MAYVDRTEAMEMIEGNSSKFKEEVQISINSSKTYRRNTLKTDGFEEVPVVDKEFQSFSVHPKIEIVPLTSDAAIQVYANQGLKTALLNFASFCNPGGSVSRHKGRVHIAQEESVCIASTLFKSIGNEKFKEDYEYNIKHTNKGLYEDWAIYSPNIVFPNYIDKKTYRICDVITCASPDYRESKKTKDYLTEKRISEYRNIVFNRIRFVLDVLAYNSVECPILGAFGCGVFENPPTIVASIFKELLETYDYGFKKVVFAIPQGANLFEFEDEFNIIS